MTVYDPDWYAVVEAEHEIQNPVSAGAIRALGKYLDLGPSSQVLDLACGTCGPAIVLAREYGCHVTGVDKTPAFVEIARERIERAELIELVDLIEADAAATRPLGGFDVAICLGASFVFGGMVPALEWLALAAPMVVLGEPFLRIEEKVAEAETAGVDVRLIMISTEQDWLAYEAQRARTLERWLKTHREHAFAYRRREQEAQRRRREERRGWAMLVARVIPTESVGA